MIFSQVLLPTIDSKRCEYLINIITQQTRNSISNKSVLLIGGSGTAKTSSILMLGAKFDSSEMLMHRINFSSATLPVHFQTSIESVCETKIRKGFGPKDGKIMTVFVDDFSMPEKNDWGDQITLEIVRQLMEDSGFYKLDKNERGNFKFIENLQYLAAMNHPGGGRNDIPNRLKRQFFIFNMVPPARIDLIFNPILKKVFDKKDYSQEVLQVLEQIPLATIKIWNNIKSVLLPTPSKFHYLFNLRDLSRIFKGMCQISPETVRNSSTLGVANIKPALYIIALWKYECERVFCDKLINNKDKQTAIKYLNEISMENFSSHQVEI